MYAWYLGLSYLFKRPINLLGFFGVLFSTWALITVMSVFEGFIVEVRAQVRGAASDLALVGHRMDRSYAEVEKLLVADPQVAGLAPRIAWFGLLYDPARRRWARYVGQSGKSLRSTDFVRVLGIDPEREARVSGFVHWLEAADVPRLRVADPRRPFSVPQEKLPRSLRSAFGLAPPGILMGLERASYRRIFETGRRFVFATGRQVRTEHGVEVVPIKKDFVLAGVFDSGHYEFDSGTILVDIEEMRSLFGQDAEDEGSLDVFNEIAIAVRDPAAAETTAERLNARLRRAGVSGKVLTWEQRQHRFLQAVEHEHGMMTIVLFVIVLVASVLIFATLSMMVSEKTRDIGVLTSMGATRRGVAAIFLTCGTATAAAGAVLGEALGWLSCVRLDDINAWLRAHTGFELFPKAVFGIGRIPYVLDPVWFTEVFAFAVLAAFLFSLAPALRAARLDPVEALRHE